MKLFLYPFKTLAKSLLVVTFFMPVYAHAWWWDNDDRPRLNTQVNVPIKNSQDRTIGGITQAVHINPYFSHKKVSFDTYVSLGDLFDLSGSSATVDFHW